MPVNPISREAVLEALRTVIDPELHKDIVTLNMAKDVEVRDGAVSLTVMLTTPACPLRETIEKDVRNALSPLGVTIEKIPLTPNYVWSLINQG